MNCQKTCKKCKNLEVMVVQGLDDVFHKQLQLVEKAAVTSTAQLPLKSEKTADRSPIGGVRQSISGFYWKPGKWRFQSKFYIGKKLEKIYIFAGRWCRLHVLCGKWHGISQNTQSSKFYNIIKETNCFITIEDWRMFVHQHAWSIWPDNLEKD